jgi:hypothetical protein
MRRRSAFVPWTRSDLAEILCHQEERIVGNDNTVIFGKLRLQIEPSPLRPHFVKANVQVRRYADDTLAIFYGPRCIGRYRADGRAIDAQSQNKNEAANSLVTKTGQLDLLATGLTVDRGRCRHHGPLFEYS